MIKIKIFIDAGHGGTDPGATANGLKEKDLTLTIAKETKRILDNEYKGHTTKLSRDKDIKQSLKERVNLAKKFGAEFFLSIHINAGGGYGFESFIYNGKLMAKTSTLRNITHKEIMKQLKCKDRGMKKANFVVLRKSSCPAMLTENLFIDNKEDSQKLKDKNYLNKIAKGHALGLAKALNLKNKNNVISSSEDKSLYRVIAGSYNKKENAIDQYNYLKSKGIESFILKI